MKRNLLVICASTALLTAGLTSCSDSAGREPDAALWQEDFRYQPVAARPQLEVVYTDSSRTAFEILAEEYHLIGQLRAPHLLQNKADGTPWLWFGGRVRHSIFDAELSRRDAHQSVSPGTVLLRDTLVRRASGYG